MYAQDHEESFPSTTTIWQDINVDAGVLICPTLGKGTPIGYAYNNLLSNAAIGTLADPMSALLTADGSHAATGAGGIYLPTVAGQIIYTVNDLDTRHSGNVIASFADGHVATINSAPKLSGLPAVSTVMLGTCPYTVLASISDTYVNGAPVVAPVSWAGTASCVLIDENRDDPVQTGKVTLSGNPYTVEYSATSANCIGIVKSLYSGFKPTSSSGATLYADGSQPPLLRVYRRIGHADFLADTPSDRVSNGAGTIANSTSSGASYVIGTTMTAADRWRADPAATANYIGVTFGSPTKVKGMRVISGESNGTTWRWQNYHVQLQYTAGGAWDDVGTANQTTNFYWCYLGNRTITGVRLYGDNAMGNNPTGSGGLIIDKIHLYAP